MVTLQSFADSSTFFPLMEDIAVLTIHLFYSLCHFIPTYLYFFTCQIIASFLSFSLFLSFLFKKKEKEKKVPSRGNSLRWEFMASESFDPENL